MNRHEWWDSFSRYSGRIFGITTAIVLFIILACFGWWILLFLFAYVGYWIGKNIDYGGNFKNIDFKSFFKWRKW